MVRTSGPALPSGRSAGVDRPDRALAGVVGADPHQVAGELGRGPERGVVVGALASVGA